MKTILKQGLIASIALCASAFSAGAQNTVDLTYFSDSTFTAYCPTPVLVNFDAWGNASGYDPALDSMDVYINFGDGSDTTYKIPIWNNNPPNSAYSTSVQHTYLLAGSYISHMVITAPDGVADSITHGPVIISNACASISGYSYVDNNNNCIFDSGDDTLKYTPINVVNPVSGNIVLQSWTDHDGYYNFTVPAGTNFELTTLNSAGMPVVCPVSGSHMINLAAGSSSTYDFGHNCNSSMYDLYTTASGIGFVPGNHAYMYLSAGNTSCLAENGTITLTLDPLVTYVSTQYGPAPSSVVGNVLTWNTPSLSATGYSASYWWSQWNANIKVITDTTAVVGDTVCHTISISPTVNDVDVSNNNFTYCVPVLASYDPNIKVVSPLGRNSTGDVDPNTTFTYTVHFQNTGNYPAQNVYILDTISSNLDLSTLEILSSSHSMVPLDLGNGIFKFQFNNIWLADSVSNEPESHGNVTYRISTKPNLALGTEITNTAHIYFDYNSAIVTNTTLNTLAIINSVTEILGRAVKVFPNPTQDKLTIEFDEAVEDLITVMDLSGRVVMTIPTNAKSVSFDTNNLSKGVYSVSLKGTYLSKFIVQ